MKLVLISDIHANVTAFDAVMRHAQAMYGSEFLIAHLGDAVDYGMRPNETMARIRSLDTRLLANLVGNHERAVLGLDIARFSSWRGAEACRYTISVLEPIWLDYIRCTMEAGPHEISIEGHRVLLLHGDMADPFWGCMPEKEMLKHDYARFEYVIFGHTHIPLYKEQFHSTPPANGNQRKAKTTFINPGSVGQPRNNNPASQYAMIDFPTGTVHFNAVPYDIGLELELYKGEVDLFYAHRLVSGI